MKSPEYLAGKMEGMEKEVTAIRTEVAELKRQVWSNTKWILIATGFLSAVVFASQAVEWYMRLGGKI